MKTVYLDTSAIVKRYIQEAGSDVVAQVYSKAWLGDLRIAYSVWNIGEVLGVLDKYYTRGWLSRGDYELARLEFLGETVKMLKLRVLRVVPVKLALIARTWELIERYHIYQADALQIVSAREVKASEFYTADQTLCRVAREEKLDAECLP